MELSGQCLSADGFSVLPLCTHTRQRLLKVIAACSSACTWEWPTPSLACKFGLASATRNNSDGASVSVGVARPYVVEGDLTTAVLDKAPGACMRKCQQ